MRGLARRCLLAYTLAAAAGCGEGHGGLHAGVSAEVDMGRPPPEPATTFAAIGDFGSDGTAEEDVARLVRSRDPQFVITLGDNNYPSGDRATIDANIGKYYSRYIGGYLGRFGLGSPINLFFPCIGNHEWYNPEKLQPYLDYFPELPGNRRYYEFEMGHVHFYVLDSDAHEPDGNTVDSKQAMWLKEALAAPTSACYKVVYFHHPPFSSGDFPVDNMRWPFAAWGADAVLAGHDHVYERLQVGGIPYITNGLGGSDRFPWRKGDPDPHSIIRFNKDWGALFVHADKHGISYEFEDVGGNSVDVITVPPRSPCP
jgi:hypothetical protein